jgi:uncharacterized protein YgiM (DUF1202 family)
LLRFAAIALWVRRSKKKGNFMVFRRGNTIPKVFSCIGSAVFLVFLLSCSTTAPTTRQDSASPSPARETARQNQKEEPVKPKGSQPSAPPAKPAEVVKPAPPSLPPAVPATPQPPVSKPARPPRVTQVVWGSVNLREGPGTNHKILGIVKKGTTLTVLEEKEGWLHVRLKDGKEAWIAKAATSEAPKTAPAPQSSPPKPRPM